MNAHSISPCAKKEYFDELLTEAENRIRTLRVTYEEKGEGCMETRLALGYALVPLNILYEDAYDDSNEG